MYDQPPQLARQELFAGYTDVEYVPATVIYDLQQIRENYDPEKLQELADRIDVTPTGLDLVHPVTVAVFKEAAILEEFLKDHARFYQYVYDPEIISTLPQLNNAWYIRVSGHRRGRALALKCQQLGVDPEALQVACTLQYNPTFDDARHSQIVENTSDSIKPAEDAVEVYREYCYRFGEKPDVLIPRDIELARLREIAEYLGCSEDIVESRLLYASMPDEMKKYESKGFSYSNIVLLAQLRKAWSEQKDADGYYKMTVEAADQKMRDYFNVHLLRLLQGKKMDVTGVLRGKIHEVKNEAKYHTDELFEFDVTAMEQDRRRGVKAQIAKAAMLTVELMKHSTDPKQRQLYEEFVEKLRSR